MSALRIGGTLEKARSISLKALLTQQDFQAYGYPEQTMNSLNVLLRCKVLLQKLKLLSYLFCSFMCPGGTIIFGADSMGTVVGVPEPADSFPLLLSKSIEKWVDGKLEIYLSPHKIEGKNVLALDVPPTDHLKAVNGNVYMRTGTAINEMKPLEVAARQRELLQVWSLQRAGDAKSVEGAKVKQYVDIEKVEHLLGSRPVSFASLLMQLQRLKLADRDEVFTLAGMLTVAVDGRPGMAWQDDFPQVSHSFVRMTRCDDVESWDDLTHEMKTLKRDFKGTAMQQVEGCLEWLLENASKGIDPGAALEMLINAIMHRDYDQVTHIRLPPSLIFISDSVYEVSDQARESYKQHYRPRKLGGSFELRCAAPNPSTTARCVLCSIITVVACNPPIFLPCPLLSF